ncbi:MAG: hypothetical protein RLZZ303_1801 [Candidatus Hydrogenedentota bacterium]
MASALKRAAGLALLGGVAVLISVMLPFTLVRHWSQTLKVNPESRVHAGALAPHLRHWRNALVEAGNVYFERVPLDGGSASADTGDWARRALIPALEQVLAETETSAPGLPETGKLVDAITRFRLMVEQPENLSLRRQCGGLIKVASEAVEEFIVRHEVEAYCRELPTPMRF